MLKISVGSDPEIFLSKDGSPRSAHGLLPGTKEKPFKIKDGMVQVDGMAAEIGIDAASTKEEWVSRHVSVIEQLKTMIPADHELLIKPSVRFNGNHFRIQPDEAKELGCTPDYNAYTMKENPKPDNNTTMRTAAGHVHIGFVPEGDTIDPNSDEHMMRCATLVKQLDAYLGLTSLFFDKDTKRRSMYGAAGAFRPKPYGVEYRVLSNAWLLSEERMGFVFDTTIQAVKDLMSGNRLFDKIGEEALQDYINNSSTYNADYLLGRFNPKLREKAVNLI